MTFFSCVTGLPGGMAEGDVGRPAGPHGPAGHHLCEAREGERPGSQSRTVDW